MSDISLGVAVSTLNDGINNINFNNIDKDVELIIIHQITNDKSYSYDYFFEKKVKVISTNISGLSISRNIAMKNCTSDICILTDDDIIFERDKLKLLKCYFVDNPDFDVVIFKLKDNEGRYFRNYNNIKIGRQNSFVMACSAELAFRRESICDFTFNTKFGLGAKYKGFEENIFLYNLYKNGKISAFYDEVVAVHNDFQHTQTKLGRDFYIAFGAYCRELWGRGGGAYIMAHFLKRLIVGRCVNSFFYDFRCACWGFWDNK